MFEKYATPLLAKVDFVFEVGIGKRWWLSPYLKTWEQRGWTTYHACDYMNFGSDQDWFMRQLGEYQIEAEDGQWHLVIAQQVLEHCRNPFRAVAEWARLLKRGGLLVTVSPVTWEHHKNPLDTFRIYPDGMRAILEEAGLQPLVCKMEHITQTEAEKKCQWGQSDVWDCIGIGRKP